jgi:replicative DNA helicase
MEEFYNAVLRSKTPQLSQILAYLRILKEQLSRKMLYNINREIAKYLSDGDEAEKVSFTDFSAGVTKQIRDIQSSQSKNEIELVKTQMIEIAQDLAYREKHGERTCLGHSLEPFGDMSSAISGLRNGFLYGIAGAPRRGKTTYTLELATLVGTNSNVPVLFFTWEQTKKNLTYRLLAKETRINPDVLQRKNIRADNTYNAQFAQGWQKMEKYMETLYIIEGTKEDTIDRIKAHAYNAMQDSQSDNVVIICDYLQKMPLSKAYSDEKFRVEEISTDLKRLSIELNCPIIVISSLNKEGCMIEVTENDDERPGLYHCKGSGDVEYDLDCAMIMTKAWGDTRELMQQMSHRAEARGKDSIHVPKIDIIDLYLDKNRDAPEGKSNCVQYFFFIEENRFFELGYKESTNAFRFGKIEKLLDELEEDGYVKYREIQGERRADTTSSAVPIEEQERPSLGGDGTRQKIRLKRT